MSMPPRSLGHLRGPGQSGSGSMSGQSSMLAARISEKKMELDSLKELRDLSAAVATQMENLEQKLATLSDGTEAIALVMGNWHNVLRAISMASSKLAKSVPTEGDQTPALPQTLVRIPTEHAPAVQERADEVAEAEVEASTIVE
ncbi:DASH complex subunit dad2 [Ceratocystis pirilliformis]|uniref:DASH complex subunit DAD2 n=1 Tax=Ceratocystis pirilliformis TaxID=259994 RepID=A0ABR3Z6B3_9PEZI